ncbi:MAG: Cellulose synthesis regulatory protein [Acidimicrobiales bacterium]|nr:Cellulose synthesis regulatory protein [Acidimicrobiales bacterium]
MAAAGEGTELTPTWVAMIVDRGYAPAAAFDAQGVLVYANAAIHELLGVEPGGLLGASAFDLVHPDDLAWAGASITGVGAGARPRPGQVHLRRGDGTWALLEVSLSRLDLPVPPDGPGPLSAVTVRDNWLQDAHWAFLTALTAGQPLGHSLAGLASALSHDPDGRMAIAYDEDGARRVAGPLPPSLAGVTDDGGTDMTPGTPWADALREQEPAWCPVEDLPEPWRTQGAAVGAACVAVPVPDPGRGRPALIVQWPPDRAMAEMLVESLRRRSLQAVTLALQRRESLERLERMALQDPLTHLANRTYFFEIVDRLALDGGPYGVCYVDLDRFKAINDERGHLVGDEVLVACARRLHGVARSGDVVARLGGDEFALACPGVDGAELDALADRIVTALAMPFYITGGAVKMGATVGCALASAGEHTDAVVGRADAALYDAKRGARGTWSRAGDQ